MTTLPPDLETLMPEPATHRYRTFGHGPRWQLAGKHTPPDAEPLYTPTQMREAILAATERAAKVCDNIEDGAEFVGDTRAARTAEGCAAAIRGAGSVR